MFIFIFITCILSLLSPCAKTSTRLLEASIAANQLLFFILPDCLLSVHLTSPECLQHKIIHQYLSMPRLERPSKTFQNESTSSTSRQSISRSLHYASSLLDTHMNTCTVPMSLLSHQGARSLICPWLEPCINHQRNQWIPNLP